jgi:hypothetical protein
MVTKSKKLPEESTKTTTGADVCLYVKCGHGIFVRSLASNRFGVQKGRSVNIASVYAYCPDCVEKIESRYRETQRVFEDYAGSRGKDGRSDSK